MKLLSLFFAFTALLLLTPTAWAQYTAQRMLMPAGFTAGRALGARGGAIVGGGGQPNQSDHALLWSDPYGVPVDLHPTGYSTSVSPRTDGTSQVGYGHGSLGTHPLLWQGSASSALDLHSFTAGLRGLTNQTLNGSRALAIDEFGNVYGYGVELNSQRIVPIVWSLVAVPEPGALALLVLGGIGAFALRRPSAPQ